MCAQCIGALRSDVRLCAQLTAVFRNEGTYGGFSSVVVAARVGGVPTVIASREVPRATPARHRAALAQLARSRAQDRVGEPLKADLLAAYDEIATDIDVHKVSAS